MTHKILTGDSAELLKTYPDCHFDAVITDPPYGIAFLGKDWDSRKATETTSKQVALQNLPSGMKHTSLADDLEFQYWMRGIFAECYRILKPGGFLLAFSAARTYHHMAMAAQTAGFEIRDQLMWIYSSGFPKAQAVKSHPGWKTALKPAHEPIVMARKPFKGSTKDNMLAHGVGALNIDASRIPFEGVDTRSGGENGWSRTEFGEREPAKYRNQRPQANSKGTTKGFRRYMDRHQQGEATDNTGDQGYVPNEQGRFPSNVLGEIPDYQKYFYCPKVSRRERHCGFEDPGPQFQVPTQFDVHKRTDGVKNAMIEQATKQVGNNHPTVKPVALMRYLIQLVTPPNGRVLDPFCGSGSTGMAACELGHDFVGCDLDPHYVAIAARRIEGWISTQGKPAQPTHIPAPFGSVKGCYDQGERFAARHQQLQQAKDSADTAADKTQPFDRWFE